jgi:hypothetical protein
VQLLAQGDGALVAWGSSSASSADFVVATVSGPDLHASDEVGIATGAASVHGVRLDAAGDRIIAGWIEGPSAKTASSVRMRVLDLDGRPSSPAATVGATEDATSLALRCQTSSCRAIIGRGQPGAATVELVALAWDPAQTPVPAVVLTKLSGVAPEDMSPVFVEDAMFFAEDNLRGEGRLRRLSVEWP